MKWLEIISLRVERDQEKITREIARLLSEVAGPRDLVKIRVYSHGLIENDLAIHLFWETKTLSVRESFLGQELRYGLKEFGLTHHSLWKEEE